MTNKDQGNLAEAYAIFKLTELGFKLSKPLIENISYDLVADDGCVLYKVQVKSSTFSRIAGKYEVSLVTNGGNMTGRGRTTKPTKESCDLVFIHTPTGSYLIPIEEIDGMTKITVGGTTREKFLIK